MLTIDRTLLLTHTILLEWPNLLSLCMRHQGTAEGIGVSPMSLHYFYDSSAETEFQCWRAATASLDALNNVHEAEKGVLGKANRWISIWPESTSDADYDYENAAHTAHCLANALRDIRGSCARETKYGLLRLRLLHSSTRPLTRSLDETIDRVEALIALRKASEARALPPPPRAREELARRREEPHRKYEEPVRKRQRLESSPSVSVSSPDSGAPATPRVTITLPPRTRGAVPNQKLPLKPGRQVVYRLAEGGTEDTSYILAIVVKLASKDRTRCALVGAAFRHCRLLWQYT